MGEGYGVRWDKMYKSYFDEYVYKPSGAPSKAPEDINHEQKLRKERAHLRSLILAEKGRSGLEGPKSIDRLISAIQEQGFTID